MSRIGNMWLCFVVHVVGTYDFDHPGNIHYVIYCLAMLVDGDWIMIHTSNLIVILIMVQLKVATLIHIWVDCLFGHLENPVLS